jgi:hypothetical protein
MLLILQQLFSLFDLELIRRVPGSALRIDPDLFDATRDRSRDFGGRHAKSRRRNNGIGNLSPFLTHAFSLPDA